jgi:hypothetical protein
MEKSHEPAAARVVLEALGLACKFPPEVDEESEPVDLGLLWHSADGALT